MLNTVKNINKLKISTSDSGRSIITSARKLLKAGASENKKKKSLSELDTSSPLLEDEVSQAEVS
jgi:DNA recombination protein RmuC